MDRETLDEVIPLGMRLHVLALQDGGVTIHPDFWAEFCGNLVPESNRIDCEENVGPVVQGELFALVKQRMQSRAIAAPYALRLTRFLFGLVTRSPVYANLLEVGRTFDRRVTKSR